MASHSISSIISQVTYPLYAEVKDDMAAMINMIRRLTMTISYVTFPLMFILMLTAKPIFVLLYTEKWIQSVPYFQVLCLAGLASCLISVNLQTIAAIGKSKTMFIWAVIKLIVRLIFVVGGLVLFGMKGLLVGVVLTMWFQYFVNSLLVSKHIGYKWTCQLVDMMPVSVVSVVAAVISYAVGYFLHLGLYPDGIIKALVYLFIYLGWSFVFKPEAFTYTLTIIPQKFQFWNKKKS